MITILGVVFGALAFLATLWGVYYSRNQLREAKKLRQENQTFIEKQMQEDDVWSEKYAKAGMLLCKIAGTRIVGNVLYRNGALTVVFHDENVRKLIVSHLIEQQGSHEYIIRPYDLPQLRLKPTRDLIDVVLATTEKFKEEQPDATKELGLSPD